MIAHGNSKSKPGGGGEGLLSRLARNYQKRKYIYWMILPVMLYYIVFQYIPMFGQVIAFQDYRPTRGIFNSNFVGLKHFTTFFNGPYAFRLIRNTIFFSLYDIVFAFPVPIMLAVFLNELKDNAFKRISQTITYMPHFVSLVVMCGMIRTFTNANGIITALMTFAGLPPVNLLSKPEYFRTIYTASTIWKNVGWGSIIYLASLSGVDSTLYEAAGIDGAGRLRKIWHITMPSLIPIVAIQLIMRVGNIMSQGAEKIILLYSPVVYETADAISSYVYRVGISEQNYSLAAAVGMFNSMINLGLVWFANWFSRTYVKESLW